MMAFQLGFFKNPPLKAMDAQGQETRPAVDTMEVSYLKLIEASDLDAAAGTSKPAVSYLIHDDMTCIAIPHTALQGYLDRGLQFYIC